MLITSAKIESYLGLSSADAARVFRFAPQAEAYLRRLKGDLWYDAVALVPSPDDPGGGPDAADPVLTLDRPLAGDVSAPVLIAGEATDDVGVIGVEYRWDGGPWRSLPLLDVGVAEDGSDAPPSVRFAHRVWLPQTPDARDLDVRARDLAGNSQTVTVAVRVTSVDSVVGGSSPEIAAEHGEASDPAPAPESAPEAALSSLPYYDLAPPTRVRQLAERAEATLALYYALPHLNLRLDGEGGIVTTIWTDLGEGTKQQSAFAQFDSLDALRRELMTQAHLLVDGDVRVDYAGDESGLLDGVEGYASGGGFLGFI